MGVGGGGLHVHVYQFKLKGLAGGGEGVGRVGLAAISTFFKVLFRSHIPQKYIIFLGLLYRSKMCLD